MSKFDMEMQYEIKYKMKTEGIEESVNVVLNYEPDEDIKRLINEFANFLRKCGYAEGTVQKFINEEF